MQQRARVVVWAVGFAVAVSCGGGVVPKTGGTAQGSISGVVFKGPVAAGTVRAIRLGGGLQRGDELASTSTDADGAFEMKLPPYSGPLLVVASSGTYTEEAIGLGVKLDGNELTSLVPAYTGGAVVNGMRLTPVSSLATSLALFHAGAGQPLVEALDEARAHLNAHFGGVDWATVSPADLTVAGVTNLSPEARAGLVLAGLSWQAKMQAEVSDVTPGLVVNAATLTTALVRDAADGTLDGRADLEQLKSAKVDLTGLTLRTELVQGMSGFINSTRNASALKLQDVTAFLAQVGTNNDAYLFCPGQMPAANCGSGPVDTEPPVVAFVRPNSGAGVAGSAVVEVRASDNVKLKTLRFTAPSSLMSATPTFSNEGREAVLQATLDVSAIPDGPLEVRVEAADESNNPAAKSITVTVSNLGPKITITAPAEAATVRGSSVPVAATAVAQAPGASITKLELVSPPAGMGPDTLPAADSFQATWNSSVAPEGPTTLTFRATDSFGTAVELPVAIAVDNVPFGRVTAFVSAGAPVDGVKVRLVAIDEVTGLPVAGRLGGAVLGESADVTVDGGVSFELSQENWAGPVQLVAAGTSAAYVDPSDGVTGILLPASFTLTSYVSSYSTGGLLSAPVTYATTLADEAVRAYATGRNPASPSPVLIGAAMQAIDPLISRHVTTSTGWNVRAATPVSLTSTPQSLRDVVLAAFIDVALNQEARVIATDVGLTPGTAFGAPQLVTLLRQDLADGLFDGKASGAQLRTGGMPAYELDANTTRFKQAIALDAFIRSPQNRTGLTRPDLQTQAIFDTMSTDTSLLYPANQPPIPFDNAPPLVSWTVTFTNGMLSDTAPVGTSKLVSGLLRVEASASDASQVASLSVTASGTPLVPDTGSTTSLLRATFDTATVVDGQLTLAATACDRLANCATTTFVVTVDRTAPAITVLKPTAGFYSASFDIEATAVDAQGLASLTATAPSGLVDQDVQPGRLFVSAGAWTLAAGDGAFAAGYRACDAVGNCATASAPVTIDKTPPLLSWATQPPQYTKNLAVSFSVTAGDGVGAGVARVFAGVDYFNPVEGTRSGNTWTFTNFDLGGLGNRVIRVWAEDLATPTNSGRMSSVAGADLGFGLISETTAPSLIPASYRSFKDEDAVTLVLDGQGRPVVPAQYNYGATPARTIDLNAASITIKKAVTLVGATSNRPQLTWQIPFNALTDSPITSVTWTVVRTSCRPDTGSCSSTNDPGGSLAVDSAFPSPVAGNLYYSMELAMATKGTYVFTFTATDAAGNSTSRNFTVVWDVVGPPLVVVPDTAWESSGDPQSALPLRVSDGSYGRLFGVGVQGFTANQARLRRYLVYNAAPVEVAVWFQSQGTPTRASDETWTNILGNLWAAEGDGQYSVDGHTFDRDYWTTWSSTSDWCSNVSRIIEPYPCAFNASSLPYAMHVRGSSTKWTCTGNVRTETAAPWGPVRLNNTLATIQGAADTSVTAQYASPASAPGSGNESSLAGVVNFNVVLGNGSAGARVPAATSTAPGVVAVYVVVPISTHTTPLSSLGLPHLSSNGRFQYYYGDIVDVTEMNTPEPGPLACNATAFNRFATFYWYRRINAANTSVTASFTVQSGGGIVTGGLLNNQYYSAVSNRQVGTAGGSFTVPH